jgi:hypothetical protein
MDDGDIKEDRVGTAAVQGGLWSGNSRNWAELQEPFFVPMYRAVLDGAVVKAIGSLLPPPPPGTPGPFALSEPGLMEQLLAKAGLTPGQPVDVDSPFVFVNEDAGCRGFASSGPGIRAIRAAGADKVRATLLSALAPFKTKSGTYHLDNKFCFIIARP